MTRQMLSQAHQPLLELDLKVREKWQGKKNGSPGFFFNNNRKLSRAAHLCPPLPYAKIKKKDDDDNNNNHGPSFFGFFVLPPRKLIKSDRSDRTVNINANAGFFAMAS